MTPKGRYCATCRVEVIASRDRCPWCDHTLDPLPTTVPDVEPSVGKAACAVLAMQMYGWEAA